MACQQVHEIQQEGAGLGPGAPGGAPLRKRPSRVSGRATSSPRSSCGRHRPARQHAHPEAGLDQLHDRLGELDVRHPLRPDTRRDQHLAEDQVRLARDRVEDEVLGAEVLGGHEGPRLRRCPGGITTTISSRKSGRRSEAGVAHRPVHDREVDRASSERRDRVARGARHHLQVHVGMRPLEAAQPRGQPVVDGVALRGEAQQRPRPLPPAPDAPPRRCAAPRAPARAERSRRSPAGVSTIRLPMRSKSRTPSRSSASRSWWLSADWVRCRRSPARVTLPSSATARTSCRWRTSSIGMLHDDSSSFDENNELSP